MPDTKPKLTAKTSSSLWSNLFLLAFGLGVLGFLVAIERQNWFELRPASGTAAAMSHASSRASNAGEVIAQEPPVKVGRTS